MTRYYGVSAPTPNMSDANLQYLSSHQALSDLAQFVRYVMTLTTALLCDTHYCATV